MTAAYSVYTHSVSRERATSILFLLVALSYSFFLLACSVLSISKCSSISDRYFFWCFPFTFYIVPFVSLQSYLFVFIFLSVFSLSVSLSKSPFSSILYNDCVKSAKDPSVKIVPDVSLHNIPNGKRKFVASATVSGMGVIDSTSFNVVLIALTRTVGQALTSSLQQQR